MKLANFLLSLVIFALYSFSSIAQCPKVGMRVDTHPDYNGRIRDANDRLDANVCKDNLPCKFLVDSIPNASYQLFKNGKKVQESKNARFLVEETGIYQALVITNTGCSVSTAKWNLNITEGLSVVIIQDKITICNGNSTTIYPSIGISGSNPPYYPTFQWSKNGVFLPETNQKDYTVSQAGKYSLFIQEGKCSASSIPIDVVQSSPKDTLKNIFKITASGLIKDEIILCDNLKENLFTNEDFGYEFQWFKNNKQVPNKSYNGKKSNYLLEKGSAGEYFAISKDYLGCTLKTQTVKVTEKEKETSLVSLNYADFNSCKSDNMTIYIPSFSKDSFKSIELYEGNRLVDSQRKDIFQITEQGSYYVKIKTENGCIGVSNILNVKLKDANPKVYLDYNLSINYNLFVRSKEDFAISLCPNSAILIWSNFFIYSNNEVKYNWYKDGKQFGANPELSTKQSGKYHLKIEDNGCTYNSDTLEVKVLSSILKPMTVNDLCEDGQIKMKVSPKPAGAFSWYYSFYPSESYSQPVFRSENKEVLTPPFIGTIYNFYTLATDENLCVFKSNAVRSIGLVVNQVSLNPTTTNKNFLCWGDSVKISVSNPEAFDSFQWYGPLKFKATGAEIKIKKLDTYGTYEVVGKTKSGCLIRQENFVYYNKPLGIQPYHVNCDDVSVIKLRTYDSDSTSSSAYGDYFFSIFGPNQVYSSSSITNPSFNLKAFNANVNGKFTISNLASNNYSNCFAKADIMIDLAKKSCQGIRLTTLNKEIRVCPQTTYDIAFTTADMPVGTVYEVFMYSTNYSYYSVRVGSGTKSPIKITIPNDNAGKFGLGYYIRTTDGKFQSESSDNRTFVVIDGQTFFNIGNDAPQGQICSGKVNFTAEQVSVPINYQWVVDNVDVPNATKPTFALEKTGNVFLKYSQTNGCTYNSGTTYITIGSIRTPSISTTALISCKNEDIPIIGSNNYEYSSSDYSNKFTYQWYKDDKLIEGAKTKNFFPKESGIYSLKTSIDGCESPSSNRLKINKDNNFPVNITGYSEEQTAFCKGQIVYIGISSNSYNSSSVLQWQKDGIDIPNANSISYQAKNNGVYSLRIAHGNSCFGLSNEMKIQFQDKIKLKLLTDDALSCEGKKTTINLDYRTWNPYNLDFGVAQTNPVIANMWIKDGKPFSASSNLQASISTYEKGKFNSVNKIYRNDTLLCTIESDTLEVKNVNSYAQTTNQKVYNCADSLVLNSGINLPNEYGTYSFEWKKDNQSIYKTNFVSSIVAKSSGTYSVQATFRDGCTITKSTEVVLGQIKPTLSIYGNSVCDGNAVYLYSNLNANYNNSFTGYKLQKDGKDVIPQESNYFTLAFYVYESGKYTIKATIDKCTGTSDPIDVNIIKLSEKLLPNVDTVSYCGQNLVELISDNPVTHQYKWELNEKPLSAFTQNLTTKTDGRYRVIIRKEGCARYSNSIVVNTDIVPNKLNVADSSVCGIKTIDLKAPVVAGLNYTWEKDGKAIPDSPYGLFQAKESGTYRALLTKARCKIYSTEAKIKMKPLPDAMVTPEVTGIVYQPGTVKLNASVGTGYLYQWLKDAKILDGAKSSFYEAKEAGRYEVAVTLDGCTKQSGVIEVKIEIPLATENFIDPSGVSVYPNPSNGSFKIDLPNDLKNAQIQLFDNLGVEHNLTKDEEGKYWINNLPQGKYLLRISKQEKSVGKHLMVEK
jgi:Secretion system C-terminal sorting domain